MIKVAKEYVGQLTFAVSSKGDFSHEIDEFGGTKEEVFAGIFGADGKKYSYGEKKFRFVIPLCMPLSCFSCFCVYTTCHVNCFCVYTSADYYEVKLCSLCGLS